MLTALLNRHYLDKINGKPLDQILPLIRLATAFDSRKFTKENPMTKYAASNLCRALSNICKANSEYPCRQTKRLHHDNRQVKEFYRRGQKI